VRNNCEDGLTLTVTILTERLELREFTDGDWSSVHEYDSDPEVTLYAGIPPSSKEDTTRFLQTAQSRQNQKLRTDFDLAVVLRSGGSLIGGCYLGVTDQDNRQGRKGYLLNKKYWGKGYATEASRALLSFGFEKLGLHRIYAECDPDNLPSLRVLEKIGMHREGRLREAHFERGKWRDYFLYAIIDVRRVAGGRTNIKNEK
jgi:RimJ/RimL family protein N-acetyltransferase